MTTLPTLVCRDDLGYELLLPGFGWVGEITGLPGGRPSVDSLADAEGCPDDYPLAERAFTTMLDAHGVSEMAPRADAGPLPGRYEGHPWAVEAAAWFAIEATVSDMLVRIPHEVSVVYEHQGDGDPARMITVPFEGWETLDTLLRTDPYGEAVKTRFGESVARRMEHLRQESAARRGFQGELVWYIGFNTPSEAEVARIRLEVARLRQGLPRSS